MSYEKSPFILSFINFDIDLGPSITLVGYKWELFHMLVNLRAIDAISFTPQLIA